MVDKHQPRFQTKIVCRILEVLPGTIDDEETAFTVVLTPAGTDLVFWLPSNGFGEDLFKGKGNYVYADLSAVYSSVEKCDERNYGVFDSPYLRPSMMTKTSYFTAVGQYLGFSGENLPVQSEFLILFNPETPWYFEVGDWVKVTGSFTVDWSSHDIIDA